SSVLIRGEEAGRGDRGPPRRGPALLLCPRAQAARTEGGPPDPEATPPPPDRVESRRSPPLDRWCEESLSPHAAPDAVRHGAPTQRAIAAEGRRHRQPAHGGARRTGEGRTRPRGAAHADLARGAPRVLPLDAPADVPLSRPTGRLAHRPAP